MPNPGCQVLTCLPVQVAYICFINIFFPAQTIQTFFFLFFLNWLLREVRSGARVCMRLFSCSWKIDGGLCQKYYDERVGECVRSDD